MNRYTSAPGPQRQNRGRRIGKGVGIGLIAVVVIAMCSLCAIGASGVANQAAQTPTPTASASTAQNTGGGISLLTATARPKHPTAPATERAVAPTARPTHIVPRPTPTAKSGVNGNPWGYTFAPGSFIYSPPSAFCSYFACIGAFWAGRGYVVECIDSDYSKSGGIQGACSHHGGEERPLYAH